MFYGAGSSSTLAYRNMRKSQSFACSRNFCLFLSALSAALGDFLLCVQISLDKDLNKYLCRPAEPSDIFWHFPLIFSILISLSSTRQDHQAVWVLLLWAMNLKTLSITNLGLSQGSPCFFLLWINVLGFFVTQCPNTIVSYFRLFFYLKPSSQCDHSYFNMAKSRNL